MSELTIFLKYLVMPSGFLKDLFSGLKDLFHPKRLTIMFIIAAAITLIIVPYNKKIVSGGFLLLALLMQFRIIYKAGDHNRWKKEKLIKEVKEDLIAKEEIKEDEEDGTGTTESNN